MSYIFVDKKTGTNIYPYSIDSLIRANPNTSFILPFSDDNLAQWDVFPVIESPMPSFNQAWQYAVKLPPVLIDGKWHAEWQISNKNEEQLAVDKQNYEHQAVENAQLYLSQTDWYVIRFMETGKEIPEEVVNKRAQSRIILSNSTIAK